MSHQWPYNLMWIVMMCTGAPIYVIGQRDCMCCAVVTCAVFIELHWIWIPYLIATYSYIYRSKLSPSTALNIVHSRVVSVTYYTRSNRVGFIKHAEQQKVHRILLTTLLSLSLHSVHPKITDSYTNLTVAVLHGQCRSVNKFFSCSSKYPDI